MAQESWQSIRDTLSSQIVQGLWAPGAQLPTEGVLCQAFQAGRHSVRRAIGALAVEGKLRVEQGRGTFVQTAPLISYHIGRRTRFRQNLLDQGVAPAGEQIAAEIIPASAEIATALALSEGTPVHRLLRRGLADGVPINISLSWHCATRFPDLAQRRESGHSITDIYRDHGIATYARKRTVILTRHPDAREAALLHQHPDQPVMVVQKRWIIAAGLTRLGEYLQKTLPSLHWATLGADLAAWFWAWRTRAVLLAETILIAFMATALGVFGGFALSFLAARNLSPNPWVLWITRRFLEVARTVPELVWALIFVFSFGIGPMAGVLAIALHCVGALGKLYSEANENNDMRPLDGVKSAGGNWVQQMRFGAVPQVLPNIISYTLLRFEINVRSSSIIGYVGAGGLGQEFRTAVSLQEYTDLSALFVIIFATVMLIDYGSEKLRHRFIGLGIH